MSREMTFEPVRFSIDHIERLPAIPVGGFGYTGQLNANLSLLPMLKRLQPVQNGMKSYIDITQLAIFD